MTTEGIVVESGRIGGAAYRQQLVAGIPVTERRLRVANVATALLTGGTGAPMLLLHGPAANATHWASVMGDLVGSFHLIAPDLPGHGESKVDVPLDAGIVLHWLDELIDQTCSERPILVGQALGGAIAARYAATRPHALRQLILVDALGLASFAPAPDFGRALQSFLAEPNVHSHDDLWEFCARDLTAVKERMGGRWETFTAYNLDRVNEPEVRAAVGQLMEAFGMEAIPRQELVQIEVPTALIWGKHDLATPLDVAQRTSAEMGWPLHVIDAAGDDPAIETPAEFLEVLRYVVATKAFGGGAK